MSSQRTRKLPDILRLQKLMRAYLPEQADAVSRAKIFLIYSMLFGGLNGFYELVPDGDDGTFADTLCRSLEAVLLAT